jgi:p-aminobenzoyl-glutamate transporter AbgT
MGAPASPFWSWIKSPSPTVLFSVAIAVVFLTSLKVSALNFSERQSIVGGEPRLAMLEPYKVIEPESRMDVRSGELSEGIYINWLNLWLNVFIVSSPIAVAALIATRKRSR